MTNPQKTFVMCLNILSSAKRLPAKFKLIKHEST